jgi:hypothetical protein
MFGEMVYNKGASRNSPPAASRGAKEKQYAETERRRLSGRDGRKYEYRRNRTMNNALVRKDLLYDPHNG